MSGLSESERTNMSKQMSLILRHKPPKGMDESGWVPLPALMSQLKQRPSEDDIRAIVAADTKGRFVINDDTRPPRIRAAQGHSVPLPAPVLDPVTDAASVPPAVHVTSEDGWASIQECGELRRMKRTHVHFATRPDHERANDWATAQLLLDLRGAMAAGLEFAMSTNGVLLCEGPVPARFLKRVSSDELARLRAEAPAKAPAEAPAKAPAEAPAGAPAEAPAGGCGDN